VLRVVLGREFRLRPVVRLRLAQGRRVGGSLLVVNLLDGDVPARFVGRRFVGGASSSASGAAAASASST